MKYCFGIDVGGTTIKMGFFETAGDLIEKWEIKTRTQNNGEAILSDIAQAIDEKLQKHHVEKDEVKGIGIGIPAPVNSSGIVKNTVNLGWGYKEVTKELTELTGLYAIAGNDATFATLGEMWKGGGNGQKNMVMVTLGTGVGGGIIIDGKPVIGTNGAAGEIGHICMNPEEKEPCGCGRFGCLEQYASATGITRLANRRLKKNEDATGLRNQNVNAKTVFDALKSHDMVAKEIIEEFGSYLGRAMAAVATVCDPSVIVIGGGVSNAGEILIKYVEKYFKQYAFFAHQDTRFALAELGNDAGIHGAAKIIIDSDVVS